MKTYNLYSIRKGKNGQVWIPIGRAVENRDASLAIYLDALPIDGVIHARPPEAGRINEADELRAEVARLEKALGVETEADLAELERQHLARAEDLTGMDREELISLVSVLREHGTVATKTIEAMTDEASRDAAELEALRKGTAKHG